MLQLSKYYLIDIQGYLSTNSCLPVIVLFLLNPRSFEDNPAKLDISDFPKPSNKESHTFNGVLSSNELIQKVRNSFLRYWRIIDQHGAQFELYVNKFESAVNPILHNLELGYLMFSLLLILNNIMRF